MKLSKIAHRLFLILTMININLSIAQTTKNDFIISLLSKNLKYNEQSATFAVGLKAEYFISPKLSAETQISFGKYYLQSPVTLTPGALVTEIAALYTLYSGKKFPTVVFLLFADRFSYTFDLTSKISVAPTLCLINFEMFTDKGIYEELEFYFPANVGLKMNFGLGKNFMLSVFTNAKIPYNKPILGYEFGFSCGRIFKFTKKTQAEPINFE
jgi:hypothetical protein